MTVQSAQTELKNKLIMFGERPKSVMTVKYRNIVVNNLEHLAAEEQMFPSGGGGDQKQREEMNYTSSGHKHHSAYCLLSTMHHVAISDEVTL